MAGARGHGGHGGHGRRGRTLTLAGVALPDQPHHQGGAVAALRGAGEGLDAELVSFGLEEEHQEGEARALRKRPLCDRADKQLGHDLEKPKAGDCAGRSAGPRQRLADTGGDARPSSRSRESAPPPEKTCRPREEGRLAGRSAARLVLARPPHGLEPPGGLARGHGVGLAATRQPCRGR